MFAIGRVFCLFRAACGRFVFNVEGPLYDAILSEIDELAKDNLVQDRYDEHHTRVETSKPGHDIQRSSKISSCNLSVRVVWFSGRNRGITYKFFGFPVFSCTGDRNFIKIPLIGQVFFFY